MLVAQETVLKKKQSLNLRQPDRAQYRISPICNIVLNNQVFSVSCPSSATRLEEM
jgi:hypothetical protein